ncbi:MAG: hypothetical protein GY796_17685, partial [Chloroflexi bacterium]|nr:hypothetical protein [Chloroflexota bacterium]
MMDHKFATADFTFPLLAHDKVLQLVSMLDLFAEQVVWAGLVAWFEECFNLGIEHGFSPELMVLELYASGEAAEILGMMAKNGFYKQMAN